MNEHNDRGLSEVIGFVLIIGLLTIVLSLYITYVVPSIGRDNEITHMNYIKDQFVDFKIVTDSLWVNNEAGVTLSRSIQLGTQGKTAESTSTFFPILQPIGSGGTLSINERNDTITVSPSNPLVDISASKEGNLLGDYTPINSFTQTPIMNATPNHIYLTFTTGNYATSDCQIDSSGNCLSGPSLPSLPNPSTLLISSVNNPSWSIIINASPTVEYYSLSGTQNSFRKQWSSNIRAIINNTRNFSDTQYVYREFPLVNTLENNKAYSIDLMDLINGLYITKSDIQYPNSFTFTPPNIGTINSLFSNAKYQIREKYDSENLQYISQAIPLGSLDYHSSNNYWISQNYYYQMGGIFLDQIDGSVVKILPDISVTYKTDPTWKNYALVNIQVIQFNLDQTTVSSIGGTSPVQVLTTLESKTHVNLINNRPNSNNVIIKFNSQNSNSTELWKATFDSIKMAANSSSYPVPNEWIVVTKPDEKTAQMLIDPSPSADISDVDLEMDVINFKVGLQPVASTIS